MLEPNAKKRGCRLVHRDIITVAGRTPLCKKQTSLQFINNCRCQRVTIPFCRMSFSSYHFISWCCFLSSCTINHHRSFASRDLTPCHLPRTISGHSAGRTGLGVTDVVNMQSPSTAVQSNLPGRLSWRLRRPSSQLPSSGRWAPGEDWCWRHCVRAVSESGGAG